MGELINVNQTFYEYMMRFADETARDPMSRLANAMKEDIAFPKQSIDFLEITDHLEGELLYNRLLTVFDDAWERFKLSV